MDVPKYKFDLQKNSLLHKWTQVRNIITVMNLHEASTQDLLNKLIKECKQVTDLADAPNFQFLQEQLQLMFSSPQGRRYSKHVLIFAAELICISSAAYRLLRNSKTIILPREKLVRSLMNKSFQNDNLGRLLEELKPQQRLVNVLFDEVKLKKAMRYTDSHII